MPSIIGQKIRSIKLYVCGFCTNRLGLAYKGQSFRKKVFPANVFLLEHATKGKILFDTGYSTDIYHIGLKGWLYRLLNPTCVTKPDEIVEQLAKDGIDAGEIKYIVMSHLHPDHIGGIKFFPNAAIILSKDANEARHRKRFSDLIFMQLLPKWLDRQAVELEEMGLRETHVGSLKAYDMFDDTSTLLVQLSGHAHGHIGMLLDNKTLLAGDACWSSSLVNHSKEMRPLVRMIHSDHAAFIDTNAEINRLREQGVEVYFSHDHYSEGELL